MSSNKEIINTKLEVEKVKKLLDLNGNKINFYSEFLVDSQNPQKNFLVAVLDQDDLDNGNLIFEESVNGKYSKSLIYQGGVKKNHFIAVKKLTTDKSPEPLICTVIRTLEKLPELEQSKLNIPIQIQPENKTIPGSPKHESNSNGMYDEKEDELQEMLNEELRNEELLKEQLMEEKIKNKLLMKSENNTPIIFGVVCIILFIVLFLRK